MNLLKTRIVFAVVFITILAACSQTVPASPTITVPPAPAGVSSTSTASPVATSTATSLPPSNNGAQPSVPPSISADLRDIDDGLERVVESFGFAIVPEYLPNGIEASGVSLARNRARLIYGDSEDKLIVAFPVEFSLDGGAILTRPEDAVAEVEIDGRMGFLMMGGWSDATIQQGPGINPADAVWDYDKSLTLFYDYPVSDSEDVGIAVQALVNPSDWISEEDMVRIAESLTRIE